MATEGSPGQGLILSEGEPKPKGFRVKVEKPELLSQAVQNGRSGELGRALLEFPINRVVVGLESGKGTFDLVAVMQAAKYEEFAKERPMSYDEIRKSLISAVTQSQPEVRERGGNFIIRGRHGMQFVIGTADEADLNLQIATSKLQRRRYARDPNGELYPHMEKEEILPAPKAPENINAALQDLAEILGISVKNVYKLYNKSVPDEELVIGPPKEQLRITPGGIIWEEISGITTPQELLGKLEIEKPNVKFEDIGGQQEAKHEIEGLAFALKNPDLYKRWGAKPPKGVIFYGPPGTGKTLIAKALASQADARFFHVEAADISSKWYGASEKIVKDIFNLASQSAEPTIIFFDEIDAIAPKREGTHEATQRVVSTLLSNMDGMEAKQNVMVVASTNRIDDIEPALLRAGRFDRWVEVGEPDSEGRKQILGIQMREARKNAGREVFGDLDLNAIVACTEKANGADLAEIIRRTLEAKVREEGLTGKKPGPVTTDDVLRQREGYEKIRKEKQRVIGFQPPFNGR